MSPSGGEEQVLTYLEAGGPPLQSLQEQEEKGVLVAGWLKEMMLPCWYPEDCLALHMPHIPTLRGAL